MDRASGGLARRMGLTGKPESSLRSDVGSISDPVSVVEQASLDTEIQLPASQLQLPSVRSFAGSSAGRDRLHDWRVRVKFNVCVQSPRHLVHVCASASMHAYVCPCMHTYRLAFEDLKGFAFEDFASLEKNEPD